MNRCRTCANTWDGAVGHCPSCGSRNVDERYAPSPLEDQFRAEARKCFSRLGKLLADELSVLVVQELDEEAYLLDFEVHSAHFDDSFPVHWFTMDRGGDQAESGGDLLKGLPYTIPHKVFRADVYERAEIEVADLAFRELVVWFAECWDRAGGQASRYPASIHHHDCSLVFDLKAKRWVRSGTMYRDEDEDE